MTFPSALPVGQGYSYIQINLSGYQEMKSSKQPELKTEILPSLGIIGDIQITQTPKGETRITKMWETLHAAESQRSAQVNSPH